jgi:CHASE3 domain sensor protein
MELTSFILGVCAVVVIMMIVGTSVNYMAIKVLKKELENLKKQDWETIDYADQLNNNLYDEMNKLYKYVDSRHDKLQSSFEKETENIYRIIDERQKNTEGNIRDYLTSWQNSDEFAIMLNKIKKKEFDSDLGLSY